MCRDYDVYLEDILGAIEKVARFTAGMSCEQFAEDAKTFDAVVRNLEIIGEAAIESCVVNARVPGAACPPLKPYAWSQGRTSRPWHPADHWQRRGQ